MRRDRMATRVAAAVGGAGVWVVLLAVAVVASPWRPSGLLVGIALVGVAVPAVVAAGTAAGLRAARQPDAAVAAGIAALGAPVLVLLVLFAVDAARPSARDAVVQAVALLAGGPAAAGLAARFTGPDAGAGDPSPDEG